MTLDQQWAAIIAWLRKRSLVLHVPKDGPIYFTTTKKTQQTAQGF